MAAHRCGGHYTAVNRLRTGAERITRLQIDRAYMRRGFTALFGGCAYMRGAFHHSVSGGLIIDCIFPIHSRKCLQLCIKTGKPIADVTTAPLRGLL